MTTLRIWHNEKKSGNIKNKINEIEEFDMMPNNQD